MKKVLMVVQCGVVGLTLGAASIVFGHEEEKENDHAHESVKLEDLPAAVQSTFKREAKGGTVEELRKETRKDGKVIYEGEIVKGGKGWELEVNADGKVIERGKPHSEEKEHEGK